MKEAFICEGIRTPIGRFGGVLSSIRTDDLAALPLKKLKEDLKDVDWESIDEVFLGMQIKQVKIIEILLGWLCYLLIFLKVYQA